MSTHCCASCGYGTPVFGEPIEDERPCPRCGACDFNKWLEILRKEGRHEADRRCPKGDPNLDLDKEGAARMRGILKRAAAVAKGGGS